MQPPPPPMAGDDSTAVVAVIQSLIRLVRDVGRSSATGFTGEFKKECTDLSRRVALLLHLLEEIRDFEGDFRPLESSSSSSLYELIDVLNAAKGLITTAGSFNHNTSPDGAAQKIAFQFQFVTCKLEKALAKLPYDHFDILEEVKEQVELVRSQLKRATEGYSGSQDLINLSSRLSESLGIESISLHTTDIYHHEVESKAGDISNKSLLNEQIHLLERLRTSSATIASEASSLLKPAHAANSIEENKNLDSPVMPDEFRCPISLELMKDPVIVSTGQTYERSYIQSWLNWGNSKCPKTGQKLQNLTLTPNYVLRSLITQWCTNHNVDHPLLSTNRTLRKSDGSFSDVSQDINIIEATVYKLSSQSIEEQRTAVSGIRSLSKRSTDNRIHIAQAGAIPILVGLLTSKDNITQQHAVTSILNLSIYENNRDLIMLTNAVPYIVQVLQSGDMETRENAAAALFSLSQTDENKIIIGASGAIPALVHLLENGSRRGKNDAASAFYRLCLYQGNQGRAVRAGIIVALLKMLTDSSVSMVDEALTILTILASHTEAKAAMVRAGILPILIHLVTVGNSRNKENAVLILLSLCKRDDENLDFISKHGIIAPLIELANNGTERAKRKASLLLGHLQLSQLSTIRTH